MRVTEFCQMGYRQWPSESVFLQTAANYKRGLSSVEGQAMYLRVVKCTLVS
jgi:hypothetical protein